MPFSLSFSSLPWTGFDPPNPVGLIASTEGGLWRSEDGGTNGSTERLEIP